MKTQYKNCHERPKIFICFIYKGKINQKYQRELGYRSNKNNNIPDDLIILIDEFG